MEAKLKLENKRLKDQCDKLHQSASEKEASISALQTDLERMKADAELAPGAGPVSGQENAKTQSQVLEDYISETRTEVERDREFTRAKLLAVEKEREELEGKISGIIRAEGWLRERLHDLVAIINERVTDPEVLTKIKELGGVLFRASTGPSAAGRVEASRSKDWMFPREVTTPAGEFVCAVESIEDAQRIMDKYISEKKLPQAADVWRTVEYEPTGIQTGEVINKLRMVCRVRDLQLTGVMNRLPAAELAALRNKEEEMLGIQADFEAAKAVYMVSQSEEAKAQQREVDALGSEVAKLQLEVERKDSTIRDQSSKISVLADQLDVLMKPQADAEKRSSEQCPSSRSAKEDIASSLEQTKMSGEQRPFAPSPNVPLQATSQPAIRVFGPDSASDKSASLAAENARNRALLRELMANQDGSTASKVNRLLYDNNVELSEKLAALGEQTDALDSMIRELSAEHDKVLSTLAGESKVRPNSDSTSTTVQERLRREIQVAREIGGLATELAGRKLRPKAEVEEKDYQSREGKEMNKGTMSGPEGKTVEAKVVYLNTKLLECNRELDRQEDLIRQKDRSMQLMELELAKREEQNKRLTEVLTTAQRDQEQTRLAAQKSERERNERLLELKELRNKCEGVNKELTLERELRAKWETERAEKESLRVANQTLTQKLDEAGHQLKLKHDECEQLTMEGKKLSDQVKSLQTERDEAAHAQNEAHERLTTNMEEYRTSMEECQTQMQGLAEKLKACEVARAQSEDCVKQHRKLMEKLRELKQDYVKLTSLSSPGKAELFQQLTDDFSAFALLIDEVTDRLVGNKKLIESLQSAVNTLQGERQIIYSKSKRQSVAAPDAEVPAAVTPCTAPDRRADVSVPSANESFRRVPTDSTAKLKATVQKYNTWFNAVQAPLRAIENATQLELAAMESVNEPRGGKLSLEQMHDIITRAAESLPRLKDDSAVKSHQIAELTETAMKSAEELQAFKLTAGKELDFQTSELERKAKEMAVELSESQLETEKLRKEESRLEEQLQREREEGSRLYDKIHSEVATVERESLAAKLEKAREEGILIGQQQQRATRETELTRLDGQLREQKGRGETLAARIAQLEADKRRAESERKELFAEREDLKQYNRAKEEIVNLVGMLKKEQEKQRQLSADLVALTDEVKLRRREQGGSPS